MNSIEDFTWPDQNNSFVKPLPKSNQQEADATTSATQWGGASPENTVHVAPPGSSAKEYAAKQDEPLA